jgi:hypothetical protein
MDINAHERLFNITLGHKFKGRWFSPGIPVSSTNKTDRHDITQILLKVALNTIITRTATIYLKYC